jgi:hypothetical protein
MEALSSQRLFRDLDVNLGNLSGYKKVTGKFNRMRSIKSWVEIDPNFKHTKPK